MQEFAQGVLVGLVRHCAPSENIRRAAHPTKVANVFSKPTKTKSEALAAFLIFTHHGRQEHASCCSLSLAFEKTASCLDPCGRGDVLEPHVPQRVKYIILSC